MNYTEKKNVLYRTVNDTNLFLDLYLPKKTNYEKLPCCVFFHGGGWCEGSKEDVKSFPLITDELFNAGFAVASVQYRLVGKNGGKFPDSVEDCLYALKYLDEQTIFPINRFRKGVFGISAGGYMSLMAALSQKHFGIYSPVSAVADMCGPICIGGDDKFFLELEMEPTAKTFFANFLGDSNPYGSNVCDHLKSSLQRPDILVIHSDRDTTINPKTSDEFYERALKEGYNINIIRVKNGNHTFCPVGGTMSPKPQDLYKAIGEFLVQNLK